MAKICVIIPDDMKEQIEKVAAEQERNLSWVVRKSLENYIRGMEDKEKCQNDTN